MFFFFETSMFNVSYNKDTLILQKIGGIVYEKTDLNDFRSNSDAKGLVDYSFDTTTNTLTFDFKGKNLINATNMFSRCTGLTLLDLSNFTGENLNNAMYMFSDCSKLASLNLSNFTGEKLDGATYMFENCSSLNTLIMKGSAINRIISFSFNDSYLSLNTGVTVDNDKTYSCTCTYDDGVKITAVTVI